MKNLILIFSIFMFSASPVFAHKYKDWVKSEITGPGLDVNNLRFTNRARCALDSKKPTGSAFVLIDNTDAAKGLYRLAKTTGQNSSELTTMGINVYRYAVIQLLNFVHAKIVKGELPLLPVDSSGKYVPKKFKKIVQSCEKEGYCTKLDEYISSIWPISTGEYSASEKRNKLLAIDNFNKNKNFILSKVFNDNAIKENLTCNYLKKFSPIQAHLYGTKPTTKMYTEMAEVMANQNEFLASCDDIDAQTSKVVAPYQIEIGNLNEKNWAKNGFDYWNSLKLYFSWAWRNAREMDQMAAPFGHLFKSLILEESVLIVPNGCKSITPAKCNGGYLSLNHLRDYAKDDFVFSDKKMDSLSDLPVGPQDDILNDVFTEVNTDILDLGSRKTAVDWLKGYAGNVTKSREFMKKKLLTSINKLNLITTKIPGSTLFKLIKKRYKSITPKGEEDLIPNNEETLELKHELRALCREYDTANLKGVGLLTGKLSLLKDLTLIDGIAGQITKNKTSVFYDYYKTLSDKISAFCNSFDQHLVFHGDFKTDKTRQMQWHNNFHAKTFEIDVVASKYKEFKMTYLKSNKPLLKFGDERNVLKATICSEPGDCARIILDSMIKLYSISQYANTFWSVDNMVKTPAFFNPYAERTQCKAYDPWYKVKSTIFDVFVNAGQAAMSAFVPGAVFLNASLKPGKVTSFRQLVKDGKISYDVAREKTKVQYDLVQDFGPLLGVPCSVSINNYGMANPYETFQFAGISVSACVKKENHTTAAMSIDDVRNESSRLNVSACVTCSLNFESVVGASTFASNFVPYVGAGLYLLRGVLKLYKNLKDPHNIPKNWKANPNYVLQTYRRFGEIPKGCLRKLNKGKRCLKNYKEELFAKHVNRKVNSPIISLKSGLIRLTGYAKVRDCNEPIKVVLKPFNRTSVELPASCAHLKKSFVDSSSVHSIDPITVEEFIAMEEARIEAERTTVREKILKKKLISKVNLVARLAPGMNAFKNALNIKKEKDRILEAERKLEVERRLEEERILEVERKIQEEKRLEAEEKIKAKRKLEASRRLEEKRRIEVKRKLEESRRLEEKRKLEEERKASIKLKKSKLFKAQKYLENLSIEPLKSRDCFIKKIGQEKYLLFINRLKIGNINEISKEKAKLFLNIKPFKEEGYKGMPLYRDSVKSRTMLLRSVSIVLNKKSVSSLEIFSELDKKALTKKISIEKCSGAKSWLRYIGSK